MNKELLEFLKMQDVEYRENALLSHFSSVKIGGETEIIVFPDTEIKLKEILKFLEKSEIQYKILGRMTNILPPDQKYNGVVVRTDKLDDYILKSNFLIASCGVTLPYISYKLCESGLAGFEGLSGIPGSIGGSVIGNAGSFGNDISDFLTFVRAYDIKRNRTFRLSKEECDFAYRSSCFKEKGYVILSAEFSLYESDKSLLLKRRRELLWKRRESQPIALPSLGSVFKRPSADLSAGKLIDECGLKGFSIGGAQVSEKHAGFIVNTGGATAYDYLSLAEHVSKCVYQKFGVNLEKEIEIM